MSKITKFKENDLKKLLLPELRTLATQFGCEEKVAKSRKKAILIQFLLTFNTLKCSSTSSCSSLQPPTKVVKPTASWPEEYTYLDEGSVCVIPQLTFSSIYEYCTVKTETKTSFKSFDRAIKHVDAGDVHGIKFRKGHEDGDDVIYFYCKVYASQRAKEYSVKVCMLEQGVIIDSTCQCPVGLASKCSHVGALLFSLEDIQRHGCQLSKTSRKSRWNVPRAKNLEMKPLDDIQVSNAHFDAEESEDEVTKCEFDPRHPSDQSLSHPDELRTSVQNLLDVFPGSGLGHGWGISARPPFPAVEVEVSTTMTHSNFNLLKSLHNNLTNDEVRSKAEALFPHIKVSQEEADYIEMKTRGQARNSSWNMFRAGRITASNIKRAVNTKLTNPSISMVRTICYPIDQPSLQTPSIKWGNTHEAAARSKYIWQQKHHHEGFRVTTCGLIVHPDFPYLGASPDGKVVCECCGAGVLEVKCPYTIREKNVSNEVQFLKSEDKGVVLDKTHPYYYQIQTQMFLSNCQYCDFVVFTLNDLFVERVKRDDMFCKVMIEKATCTFRQVILPELLGQVFTRSSTLEE